MSIELKCGQCGKMLRVPDQAAGKQARCPECRFVFTVPVDEETAGPARATDRWHMRIEDGRSYGPVPKTELDRWVAEGRVTPYSQLRPEHSEHWQWAADVYPALGKPQAPQGPNPFADYPDNVSANPYAAPGLPTGSRFSQPHRGGTILTLGILAICCNVCFIPGICAWTMGSSDLGAMRIGRMDTSGHALTQAGMVLGIIGTILSGLMVMVQVMALLANQ